MKFTSGGPCDHCDRTSSPCWRKGPPEKPTLCNACGSRYLVKKSLDGYMPQAFPAGGAVQALQREAQQKQQQRALQLLDLPSDGRARQKRTQLPSSQQRAKQRKLDQDPFPEHLSGPSALDNPAESDLHRRRMRYFLRLERLEQSSASRTGVFLRLLYSILRILSSKAQASHVRYDTSHYGRVQPASHRLSLLLCGVKASTPSGWSSTRY